MHIKDGIQLAAGIIYRSEAQLANVAGIFDRVLIELVAKMKEIRMDKCELGCLRAVVLFNPEAKGLKNVDKVEQLRESVYSTLEKYCRTKYSDQNSRFAKLLLRLPALRSVGLKCVDYLFINKGDSQMDTYLRQMLERRNYHQTNSSLLGHGMTSINNSINSSINNTLIGINSSMNSINDNHHHLTNQALLSLNLSEMSSNNNLMNVIDSNNNLTSSNASNSSGYSDLSTINSNCINFMNSNPSTMNNLIINNGSVNSSYLSGNNVINTSSSTSVNSINSLSSINHTNSPLSLT